MREVRLELPALFLTKLSKFLREIFTCSVLLFFLSGKGRKHFMVVERQLGRAGMEMRQELIINCDTKEDPGDQVLTNT